MKELSFTDKLLFFFNSLVAFLLLASYVIPFIPPKLTTTVSLLSLGMPILIVLNTIFFIYWLVKLKKQFFLSFLILTIGYQHINAFIQFGEQHIAENTIKIMSYNVRLFNVYKWSKKNDLDKNIYEFIHIKNPDIISFQEYILQKNNSLQYKYTYTVGRSSIYSKYKIIDKGSLDFSKGGNNAIYVDLKINKDTVRVYNLHLESFRIDKNKEHFGQPDSEKLLNRFKRTFRKQEEQVDKLTRHASKSPYRTIFMGDFNNTAFSWVYRKLIHHKKDAFITAGNGFGKTFSYVFPMRIDFILTDSEIKVESFKTYSEEYSDHFPIMARIHIPK